VKKIMVIDDTPDFMAFMAMLLENEDYRASIRSTGEGIFSLVKKQKPDLIILDLVLPDINGIEVLHLLREDPETRHIPAIVSTAALERVQQAREFLEAQHIEVLEKPYGLDELVGAVRRAIGFAGGQDPTATAGSRPVPDNSWRRFKRTGVSISEQQATSSWRGGSVA